MTIITFLRLRPVDSVSQITAATRAQEVMGVAAAYATAGENGGAAIAEPVI